MKQILISLVFTVLVYGCKNNDDPGWSELPEVTDIATLKNTEFVPTLESPISPGKNFVYAPTMLFAWDKLKGVVGTITLSANATDDLKKINTSSTHLGSLNE